jgi:hypothetical protein
MSCFSDDTWDNSSFDTECTLLSQEKPFSQISEVTGTRRKLRRKENALKGLRMESLSVEGRNVLQVGTFCILPFMGDACCILVFRQGLITGHPASPWIRPVRFHIDESEDVVYRDEIQVIL